MSNLLTPLGTSSTPFQVEIGGELVAADSVSAQIYKGAILTSIVPSISNPSTGVYWVSFTVPVNWVEFDTASVRLLATVNGKPIALTKPAGTVFNGGSGGSGGSGSGAVHINL